MRYTVIAYFNGKEDVTSHKSFDTREEAKAHQEKKYEERQQYANAQMIDYFIEERK